MPVASPPTASAKRMCRRYASRSTSRSTSTVDLESGSDSDSDSDSETRTRRIRLSFLRHESPLDEKVSIKYDPETKFSSRVTFFSARASET